MPETPLGIPYPDAAGHTRLWEHLQGQADAVDDLIAVGTLELAGPAVFNAVSTNPGTIVTGQLEVRAGLPLFVHFSAWLQVASGWASPRCGVAYGGPFARSADASASLYIQNSAADSSYVTASRLHVVVPPTSGSQTITLAGWKSSTGTSPNVNYTRLVAWQNGASPA